jgi:hypothetical protein
MSWGEKAHHNPETFGNFEHMTSTKLIFQRMHLSNTMLGAAGCCIPEPKPIRNISKNTIRSC